MKKSSNEWWITGVENDGECNGKTRGHNIMVAEVETLDTSVHFALSRSGWLEVKYILQRAKLHT